MTDPTSQPYPRPRITPGGIARIAFPLVLWLLATLALGGALGKSTDDYSTNLRDPATGTLPGGFRPFGEYNYFWRPAHIVLIHGLQTFLSEHDRLLHALSAAAHGLVAWLLYRFLRLTTGRAQLSACMGLLFVALPIAHEGLYFTSFICGPIASALWLWLAIAVVRFVQTPSSIRGRGWLGIMGVIALAIPFFYEQPGAAIFAFPLLVLAAWWGSDSIRIRAGHALGLTFVLGLTQIGMAVALIVTAPGSKRGSTSSLAPPNDWISRFSETLAGAASQLGGSPARQVVRGGLGLGWHTLTTTSTSVWLIALGLTAAAWWLNCLRQPPKDAAGAVVTPPQSIVAGASAPWLLSLFGLAAAVTALLPVALVSGQIVASRLMYFPSIGLAIACAGLLSGLAAWLPIAVARVVGPAAAAVVVAVTSLGSVALVGIQKQYQSRSAADLAAAGQLAALLPDPPPDTIFVPLRIEHLPSQTGWLHFDRLRPGAFETIWSATALARQTFHRRDLWAAGWNPWKPSLLDSATATHVRLNDRFVVWSPFAHEHTPGTAATRLPWANVVPFIIEPNGRVRLVRRVVFDHEHGSVLAIQPPIVHDRLAGDTGSKRLDRGNTTVFRTMVSPGPDVTPELTPLPTWRWSGSGEPAEPRTCAAWPGPSNTRQAVWIHPTSASGTRAALETTVPPSTRPRRLVIRVTVPEHDLNRIAASDPVELKLLVHGQPAAAMTVRRTRIRAERSWLPLIATLPASAEPLPLRLTVSPAAGSDATRILDPLWVTTGLIAPANREGGDGGEPLPPDAEEGEATP